MLGYICKNYKLEAISIHLVPPAGGTLKYFTGKTFNYSDNWIRKEFPIKDSIPGRAFLDRKIFRSEPIGMLAQSHSEQSQSSRVRYMGIPIVTGIRIWGVVGLITRADFDEPKPLEKFMKYFAERIGFCLDYEKADRENKAKSKYLNIHLSMIDIFNRWPDLNSSLPKISEQIRRHIEFEQLLLARLDDSGENMWRYVYSDSGRSLVQKAVSARLDQRLLGRIARSQKPELFEPKLTDDKDKTSDISLPKSNCIGAPLLKDRQLVGVLVLTAPEGRKYTINDLNVLRFLSPVFAEYLSHLNLKERIHHRESQLTCLAKGFGAVTNADELKNAIGDAARILTRELPITSCRIMLLENGGKAFRTIGLHQIRGLDWDTRSMSLIPTNSVPSHFNAANDARSLTIKFDQPHHVLREKEKRLLFYSGIASATLIPITNAGEKLGVISLGEMRNKKRRAISVEDMNFALAICSSIGILLQSHLLRRKMDNLGATAIGRGDIPPSRIPLEWARYHNEVMNALAGIMGGCELIASAKAETDDPLIGKYINVISHNGERIRDLTQNLNREAVTDTPAKGRIRNVERAEELIIH